MTQALLVAPITTFVKQPFVARAGDSYAWTAYATREQANAGLITVPAPFKIAASQVAVALGH